MSWVDNTVWWHVYPLGFTGAPIWDGPGTQVAHRLPALLDWLDYAVDLGTNGLLLAPIFTAQTHGYDTTDFFSIDPRLGDTDDFDHLVKACKDRGLRIMLDGVFNHVGVEHPLFQQALCEGPHGQYSDFFSLDFSDPQHPQYQDFEGHRGLVELNHDNPAVASYVVDVMRYWLHRGVDGWRLDAAYAVNPDFWQQVFPQVRADFPEAAFVGEVIHGDYVDIVQRSGMNSVTEYELWKAAWSCLAEKNFHELSWTLGRHNRFVENFVPMTFLGNHDVTRVASRISNAAVVLAVVVLCTVGGMPSIYYGDEQAFRGLKEERYGGDDEIRPSFPSSPEDLALDGWWIYRIHQELLALRRNHPWLIHARIEEQEVSNERYVYRSWAPHTPEELMVELDISATPRAIIRKGDEVLFSFGE